MKIASLVTRARASGVPTVLVDAGDAIEGGGIETVYQSGDRSSPDLSMMTGDEPNGLRRDGLWQP